MAQETKLSGEVAVEWETVTRIFRGAAAKWLMPEFTEAELVASPLLLAEKLPLDSIYKLELQIQVQL